MIPDGVRDAPPAEAAAVPVLEKGLRGRFVAYGYGELRMPTLELKSRGDEVAELVEPLRVGRDDSAADPECGEGEA